MESQDLFQGPQAAREDEEEALSALSGGEDGAAGTISVVPSRRDLPCRRVWLVNRNPFLENEDQRKMTSWELEGWDLDEVCYTIDRSIRPHPTWILPPPSLPLHVHVRISSILFLITVWKASPG